MRVSTVAILGIAAAAGGLGAYELGHGVSSSVRAVSTLAVAIPQQAAVAAAEANLALAVTAATAYRTEHGGYTGMTTASLGGFSGASGTVAVARATADAYCIESTVSTTIVSIRAPGGTDVIGAC